MAWSVEFFYEPGTTTGLPLLTNGCIASERDGAIYDINKEITNVLYASLF